MKFLPFVIFCILLFNIAEAQQCSGPGQTPDRAFPVCGQSSFKQTSVPVCNGSNIPVPGCSDGAQYSDVNPYWYSFTCHNSGALDFKIEPVNPADDYDWQLFDVTGKDVNAVYTDASLAVVGNWSGYGGTTGTSAVANISFSCAGNTPLTSKRPQITEGHKYLLMISHYSGDSQSGYSLTFTNGDSLITDPTPPLLQSAKSQCDGQMVFLKFNKPLRCNSLAANGSDFKLNTPLAGVQSASGVNCSNTFDMDSVVVMLDKPLPPGQYTISITTGSDNTTLLDDCGNAITEGSSTSFAVLPVQPTPMDSLAPVGCSPNTINLVFSNSMKCSSIAPDGSDFVVSGTDPSVKVISAGNDCSNGASTIISVQLNKPIQTAGNYSITLKTGSDGNTLIDICGQETLPATLFFSTADTVSADFNYKVNLGCVYDEVIFGNDGGNGITSWDWTIDTVAETHVKDSMYRFTTYGTKTLSLAVTNGVCTDTAAVSFVLDNELMAAFTTKPATELCPEDAVTVTDSSIGKIVSYTWLFGDGTISYLQAPAPKFYQRPASRQGTTYPVTLIVKNDLDCFDTSVHHIKVLYNCFIGVPGAFTPNNDGLNDYLYPLNAFKAANLMFRVYNRFGQVVFETKDRTKKWDGTINNSPQPAGTYVWTLSYTNEDTGEPVYQRGTVVLIR